MTKQYRSGLEQRIAAQLEARNIQYEYEAQKLRYIKPASNHTYLPDFKISDSLYIETKGLFPAEDRAKHLLIKEQFPDIEVRFIFSNSKTKLYKGSKSTYASWCTANGFQYADKVIPQSWLI